MALQRIPILNAFHAPDANGDTYWEPMGVTFGSNDRYNYLLLAFADQAAKEGVYVAFMVPLDYVGSPAIGGVWTTTATTGDVIWDMEYTAVDDAETLDPSSDQGSGTVTETAKGTARQANDFSMSLPASDFAPGDVVIGFFSRDGVNDTLAATAWIANLYFEYSDS